MDDIASQFKAIEEEALKKASQAFRKTVISVGNEIIVGSPVETGRLRANWQTTINDPATTELTVGADPVSSLTSAMSNFKFGETVYYTNNLPYAEFIEYGDYEGQHRQGTVRAAVANFIPKLEAFIQEEGDQ